jgi:hypothetical protein
MTFVLTEPLLLSALNDRPHLGCATLLAEARESGFESTLVAGQPLYLREFAHDDAGEFWDVANALGDADFARLGFGWINRDMNARFGLRYDPRRLPADEFVSRLRGLYREGIEHRGARGFFGATAALFDLHHWQRLSAAVWLSLIERSDEACPTWIDRRVTRILSGDPVCVGMSLGGKYDGLARAMRARIRLRSDAVIVCGGPPTTRMRPDELRTLLAEGDVDYVVVGPGDLALPRLLDDITEGRDAAGSDNVVALRRGEVVAGKLKGVADLDTLPDPDFSEAELHDYPMPAPALPVETARGCSWNRCAFCDYRINYSGCHGTCSADGVAERLSRLQRRYGVSFFIFNDNEVGPERARQIAQSISDRDLDVYVTFYARLEQGYDDADLLRGLRQAGVVTMLWGLESGSQRVLDSMRKGIDVETAASVLNKTADAGIANHVLTFFGFPGETVGEAQETARFLAAHADVIDSLENQEYKLAHDSPVGRHPEKWGVTLGATSGTYEVTSGMSSEEAKAFSERFNRMRFMGLMRVTSGVLSPRFSQVTRGSGVAAFLKAYGILAFDDAADRLGTGELEHLYPLIPGRVVRRDGGFTLCTIRLDEAYSSDPAVCSERSLTDDEVALVDRADGSHSVAEIVAGTGMSKDTAVGFFTEAVAGRWATVFARSCAPCEDGDDITTRRSDLHDAAT